MLGLLIKLLENLNKIFLKVAEKNIETVKKAQMNDNTKYVSLGDVSKILGAKF